MTQLKRKVRREVPGSENRPPYVIQLEPPMRDESAIVRIRRKGRRKWYETTIDAIFWMAVRKEAERLVAERKVKALARKAGR